MIAYAGAVELSGSSGIDSLPEGGEGGMECLGPGQHVYADGE